jgi:hypothetical protein
MYKLLKIATLSVFSLSACFSQEFKITSGSEIAKEQLVNDWELVDENENEISVVEYRSLFPPRVREVYLRKLNRKTMSNISDKQLFTFTWSDRVYYHSAHRLGESLVVFYTKYEDKVVKLLYRKFGLDGTPIGSEGSIPSATFPASVPNMADHITTMYRFLQTDKSKLSLYVALSENDKSETFNYWLFDDQLKIKKNGKLTTPLQYKRTSYTPYFSDGYDNFYTVQNDASLIYNEYAVSYFIHINTSTSKVIVNPMELGDAKIWQAQFSVLPSNDIVGFGLYSYEPNMKRSSAKAAISFKYNYTLGKFEVLDKQKLPADIIEKLAGANAVKKDKGIGHEYVARNILQDKTNDGYVIGLENISYTKSFYNGTDRNLGESAYSESNTLIGNILLCFMDKNFKINSFYAHNRNQFIPKGNFNFVSFFSFYTNGDKKCILATNDRYELNAVSGPNFKYGASALIFSKENKLISNENLPYEMVDKRRFFYLNQTNSVPIATNEVFFYSDRFEEKYSNVLVPKQVAKKYVKLTFE